MALLPENQPILIVATEQERDRLSREWNIPPANVWVADIPSRRVEWARFLAAITEARNPGDFVYLTSTNSSAIFSEEERFRLVECVARFAHHKNFSILMRLHPSESRKEVRREIRVLQRSFPGLKIKVDRAPALIRMVQARFIVHISRSMAAMSELTPQPSVVFREIESRELWEGESTGPNGIPILSSEEKGYAATATSCREFEAWATSTAASTSIDSRAETIVPEETIEHDDSSYAIARKIAEFECST